VEPLIGFFVNTLVPDRPKGDLQMLWFLALDSVDAATLGTLQGLAIAAAIAGGLASIWKLKSRNTRDDE
jgi:hypothetical protein